MEEYNGGQTLAARIVKSADKLDLLLQARIYRQSISRTLFNDIEGGSFEKLDDLKQGSFLQLSRVKGTSHKMYPMREKLLDMYRMKIIRDKERRLLKNDFSISLAAHAWGLAWLILVLLREQSVTARWRWQ